MKLLTEATLPTGLRTADNLVMCPTMDLISFQLNDTTLWIYRLNNQQVADLTLEEPLGKICWRPDGKHLAIVSKEGRVDLFNANDAKSIMDFRIAKGVQACEWTAGPTAHQEDSLFQLHLTEALPKLNDDKLLNDDAEDTANVNSLDFLVIGLEGSLISLILSGVFSIENYKLPLEGRIVAIKSRKDLASHYVLTLDNGKLQVTKLNTDFVKSYGSYLHLISDTCSKLVGLLVYLEEATHTTESDLKPFVDYTTRIIDLLKGEIKDTGTGNDDPIYDLYDLLLTGALSPATKTWLTEYLGDRGIKRWVKLGDQFFDGSKKTIFYNMIPALQHVIIRFTTLQGLSRWEETGDLLGLDALKIDEAINNASKCLKTCYETIMTLNEERRNFDSVMVWLDAIVQEVTTDEKSSKPIKTKEIIRFLMSLSNGAGIGHQSEQIKHLYNGLAVECQDIFGQIKGKMKSEMSVSSTAVLEEGIEEGTPVDMELFDDYGIVTTITDDKLQVVKFTWDLAHETTVLSGGITAKIVDDHRLLLLKKGSQLSLIDLTDGSEEQTVLSQDSPAAYLSNNSHRGICCVMDEAKKTYVVVEY